MRNRLPPRFEIQVSFWNGYTNHPLGFCEDASLRDASSFPAGSEGRRRRGQTRENFEEVLAANLYKLGLLQTVSGKDLEPEKPEFTARKVGFFWGVLTPHGAFCNSPTFIQIPTAISQESQPIRR